MLLPDCLSSRRCAGVLDRNAPPRRGISGGKPTLLPASHPSPAGLPPVPNPAAMPVHPMDSNATCALRFTGPAHSAPPAAVAAPSSPAAAVPSLHRPTQTTAPIDAPTACPPSHPPAAKQPPAATSAPPLTHLAPAARLPNSTAPASAPAHQLPTHLPPLPPPFSVGTLTPCTNSVTHPGSVLLPTIALPPPAAADWVVLHPSVHATLSLAESTAALTHRLSAGHSASVAGELGLCGVFGRAPHQQHTNTQQRCGMEASAADQLWLGQEFPPATYAAAAPAAGHTLGLLIVHLFPSLTEGTWRSG